MKYSLSRCAYKTSDEKFIKRYGETENDKVAREELIREIIEEGYVSNVSLDDDAYLDVNSVEEGKEALKEKGMEAEFDGKEIKAVWWELSEEKNDELTTIGTSF